MPSRHELFGRTIWSHQNKGCNAFKSRYTVIMHSLLLEAALSIHQRAKRAVSTLVHVSPEIYPSGAISH